MGQPKRRISDDTKRDILNRLCISPRLKPAARAAGISPDSLFRLIRESMEPGAPTMEWLGRKDTFGNFVAVARRLNVLAIDAEARGLAFGHTEDRYFNGAPVYRRDPKLEALALDPDMWQIEFGDRPITDTFARDENGGLIIEQVTHPPNAQLMVKLLTSLLPDAYAERSEITHNVQGYVQVQGAPQADANGMALPAPDNFAQSFGLTPKPGEQARQTNVLAVPARCANSEDFDRKFFKRKLLREVTLFRDADDKVLPPLPSDTVVYGSRQWRAFVDAGYEVNAVHPAALINEGYENDFLRELAPYHKRKVPDKEKIEVAAAAAKMMLDKDVEAAKAKPPYRSMDDRAEGIGPGKPPPGGRRVQL
ncbi:MAG: hypothetical protein ABSA90_06910 [Xanthobacteraceae bacterium]|jgi:hypothetical protein